MRPERDGSEAGLRPIALLAWVGLVAAILGSATSCESNSRISTVEKPSVGATSTASGDSTVVPIRIAVGGMITPKEGLAYYKQMVDYVGIELNRPVKFIDKDDYAEINMLVQRREVDAAFVCSGPYVKGHEAFGMELLCAPQAYGKTSYNSYIIVPLGSGAKTMSDLRGKVFAFADPESNTGKLVPTYMLARMGTTPDAFFGKYVYTHGHDNSIKAVARGIVDGAAVDSLVWEYENATNPAFASKTRIIWRSPPYAIPPVVVHPKTDPGLKRRLRAALLNMDEDPDGREILKRAMIERFVEIDDRDYDSIRQMNSWIEKQKNQ